MINRDKLFFRIFCILFWMLAVSSFIFEEFVPSIGTGIRSVTYSISNTLLLVMGLFTLRERNDIILIVAFILLGIISSLINHVPAALWLTDLRRTVPLLCLIPIIRYFFTSVNAESFKKSFDYQLKIFLVIQIFCLVEQFIRYGANDHGGGSLGNQQSGIISMLIILLSMYFSCKNWDFDDYTGSLWRNRYNILLMLPVFLNETKVSFLLIGLYFILLYRFTLKSVGKLLLAAPLIILAVWGMASLYSWATNSRQDIYAENFVSDYLTGGESAEELLDMAYESLDFVEDFNDQWDEMTWAYEDVPRFLKLNLLMPAMRTTNGGLIFGVGMGQLSDFETHPTKFADNNFVILYGTKMMVHNIFMPLGFLGLIWFFFWSKHILAFSRRPLNTSYRYKLMLTFIIVLTFFYNQFFQSQVACYVFYYLCIAMTYHIGDKKQNEEGNARAINNHTRI